MKALHLAAATAASIALLAHVPLADAQGPPSGGFRGGPPPGGSFRGTPPSGGSFRGGPPPRHWGGPGWRAPGPRTNIIVTRPGVWWGPGVWGGGWWGSGAWWGPGVWPGGWWGPSVAWGGWSPGVWVTPAPQTVVVAPTAPVFIERAAAETEAPAQQVWWYWCTGAGAYYPYVKECPGGWQRVAPQTAVPADRPQ